MKRVFIYLFIYGLFNDYISQIISREILQKLINNKTFGTEVTMNNSQSTTNKMQRFTIYLYL